MKNSATNPAHLSFQPLELNFHSLIPKDEGTPQRVIPTKSNKIYDVFFDLETYYNHQNALTLLLMCRLLSKFQIPQID